jgi:hypothetical protein
MWINARNRALLFGRQVIHRNKHTLRKTRIWFLNNRSLRMRIRTAVVAGMTFEQCDQIRNYWKGMAQSGSCYINPPPLPSSGTTPPASSQPAYPTSGGGYVSGVYYPDKSGIC